jgi:hypothetical protein
VRKIGIITAKSCGVEIKTASPPEIEGPEDRARSGAREVLPANTAEL